MPKGGRRLGAGRPKGTGRFGEESVPVRIPASRKKEFEKFLYPDLGKPRSFKEEVADLMQKHDVTGCMMVVVSNPNKGSHQGQVVVGIDALMQDDPISVNIVKDLKKACEARLPQIYGNATEMKLNG